MVRAFTWMALAATLFGTTGCIAVPIVAGGAAAGGYAAGQERGISGAVSDSSLRSQVGDKLYKFNPEMSDQILTTVWQGEVLLTGQVSNADWREEASRLAWQVDGVKAVYNQIEVAASNSVWDDARDTWITGRLRSALTLDSKIRSLNYNITTVNHVVYLMGSARTEGELRLVTDYASNIPNVRRVVTFIHVRPGEPSRDIAPASAPGSAPIDQPQAVPPPAATSPSYAPPPYAPPAYSPSGAPTPLAPPPAPGPAPGGPAPVQRTPLS